MTASKMPKLKKKGSSV
ncbi:hypothetical protein HP9810_854g1 [Helicobacter pylori 98-10]|nr:hypothetical protein HP9810_854g1 [Helicobacter pylori 98-10]